MDRLHPEYWQVFHTLGKTVLNCMKSPWKAAACGREAWQSLWTPCRLGWHIFLLWLLTFISRHRGSARTQSLITLLFLTTMCSLLVAFRKSQHCFGLWPVFSNVSSFAFSDHRTMSLRNTGKATSAYTTTSPALASVCSTKLIQRRACSGSLFFFFPLPFTPHPKAPDKI